MRSLHLVSGWLDWNDLYEIRIEPHVAFYWLIGLNAAKNQPNLSPLTKLNPRRVIIEIIFSVKSGIIK